MRLESPNSLSYYKAGTGSQILKSEFLTLNPLLFLSSHTSYKILVCEKNRTKSQGYYYISVDCSHFDTLRRKEVQYWLG